MTVLHQILCTGIVCCLSLNMGLLFAWPSCTTQLFESNTTTLNRPMSVGEINLFGGLFSIGAMIVTPITGYYLDVVGRKKCCVVLSLTYVTGWALIAASNRVEVVLAAVFISGFGAAGMLAVRVYVSEICQESIRGAMTTGSLVFFTCGLLLSYVLGDVLQYQTMVYVSLALAVAGVAMFYILEESPTFLMKKGLIQEASKSLAFYRRVAPDSKLVLDEINKLQRALHPLDRSTDITLTVADDEKRLRPDSDETDKITDEEKSLNGDSDVTTREENILKHDDEAGKKVSLWMFVKTSTTTHHAIILTLTLVTAGTFQGIVVLQVYAKPLFEQAVPNVSPTLCSVLQAIVTLISGVVAGFLTDCLGRRPLLIYASLATCICCVTLGTQLQFHWAPHWVTAVIIYLFCMSYTFGAGSVPYVLVTDVFLPKVKSIMSMVVIEWSWFCCFLVLFMYKPLVVALGLGNLFYVFASICLFTSLYAMLYMPETKGLPIDKIEEVFGKKTAA